MRWLVIVGVLVGCAKPSSPELVVTAFGSINSISTWMRTACGASDRQTVFTDDPSLPPMMSHSEDYFCLALGPVANAHIQIRGLENACALRIGPAALTGKFDPHQLLPLFTDQALGQRVVAALATGKPALVDGLFVTMKQDLRVFTNFMLVIDGCGHYLGAPPHGDEPHMY